VVDWLLYYLGNTLSSKLSVLSCRWRSFPLGEVAVYEGPMWLTDCCITRVTHSPLRAQSRQVGLDKRNANLRIYFFFFVCFGTCTYGLSTKEYGALIPDTDDKK
jgi:hypothetical protein